MKKIVLSFVAICFALSLSAQENLLKNGSFEEGVPVVVSGQKKTKDMWLAYFQAQRGGIETAECDGYKGKGLKITVTKCEKPVWDNYVYQNLSLAPGEYLITFYAKAASPAAERTSLRMSVKPEDSSYLGQFKAPWSPKQKIGTDWQQITHKFTISDDQTGLDNARFMITLEEAGNEFYIDEVSLVKTK